MQKSFIQFIETSLVNARVLFYSPQLFSLYRICLQFSDRDFYTVEPRMFFRSMRYVRNRDVRSEAETFDGVNVDRNRDIRCSVW
jgi:hypothetical protein